jgi:hypothetical protein
MALLLDTSVYTDLQIKEDVIGRAGGSYRHGKELISALPNRPGVLSDIVEEAVKQRLGARKMRTNEPGCFSRGTLKRLG